MKIADEIYLNVKIFDENCREAWLDNEKTGKRIRVAQMFSKHGRWFVFDMLQGLHEPCENDAISKFNLIVSVVSDNLRFLLNK